MYDERPGGMALAGDVHEKRTLLGEIHNSQVDHTR